MDKDSKIYVAGHRGMVGSAIVRMIGELGEDCVAPVASYVREMAEAVHVL